MTARPAGEAEVEIKFGVGGHMTLHLYSTATHSAQTWDLTAAAAYLASRGVTLAHTVPRPTLANASVEGDLGAGGRALWVDGGGDLTEAETVLAVSTGLEHLRGKDADTLVKALTGPAIAGQMRMARRMLVEVGAMTNSAAAGFLRRRQPALDGASINDVLGSAVATHHTTAVRLLFDRAVGDVDLLDPDRFPRLIADLKRISDEELKPWPIVVDP